jgi:predicted regulator of Ras-like GTPase activity (Roadblock/LC7/MglB family)
VGKPSDRETISSDEGSRINGILRELIAQSGAEIALVVRTEGALIAMEGNMEPSEKETVGMLSALIYGAAQGVASAIGTHVSYVHQHGDQKDLLILKINEKMGLIVTFDQTLGLGGILYNARQSAAAVARILRKT